MRSSEFVVGEAIIGVDYNLLLSRVTDLDGRHPVCAMNLRPRRVGDSAYNAGLKCHVADLLEMEHASNRTTNRHWILGC